jgi:hypothetical protein
MTRYIKQQDTYNCGPILVANVIKWAGNPLSWQEEKEDLMRKCGTLGKPIFGCPESRIQQIIEWEGKRREHKFEIYQQGSKPKLGNLDEGLENGIVAISYYYHQSHYHGFLGHCFLVTRKTPKMFEVVNFGPKGKPTIRLLSRNQMKSALRKFPDNNYFWTIIPTFE